MLDLDELATNNPYALTVRSGALSPGDPDRASDSQPCATNA